MKRILKQRLISGLVPPPPEPFNITGERWEPPSRAKER